MTSVNSELQLTVAGDDITQSTNVKLNTQPKAKSKCWCFLQYFESPQIMHAQAFVNSLSGWKLSLRIFFMFIFSLWDIISDVLFTANLHSDCIESVFSDSMLYSLPIMIVFSYFATIAGIFFYICQCFMVCRNMRKYKLESIWDAVKCTAVVNLFERNGQTLKTKQCLKHMIIPLGCTLSEDVIQFVIAGIIMFCCM